MSDRAAKLLLEIAGYVKLEADHGSFRRLGAEVSIHPRLAEEILQWSRGYKEHLLHVMERKEGVRLAKARAEAARDEMRDEEALSLGFREGQASVYELVDKAQRQRDLYGPAVPGTQAPKSPSVEERLADLECRANVDWSMPCNIVRNDSLITFSKLNNVKLAAAKRFEELEKRLGDLEEQTAFNDRNLDRADAAFVELRKELTQFVAAKVQAVERRVFNLENPDGDTRWHGVQKRLSDLEAWLGTKKLAPERNFAFETWSRIGKIEARLRALEPDVPFETWSRIGEIEARPRALEPDVPACEE